MNLLQNLSTFGTYAILAFTLLAAISAVTFRNIFHAALGLAFTLIGVATVFFVLQSEFLAAMQILLYVGAIMTLVIFAVMLTSRMGDDSVKSSNQQIYPAAMAILLLILGLIKMIGKTPWQIKETLTTIDTAQIGKELMGAYVLPFEAISIVLVIALIGAIVIARGNTEK